MSIPEALRGRVPAPGGAHARPVRALILAWLVWVWLGFLGPEPPSFLRNPLGALTLVVHESGHAAFMWFGSEMLTVAGGTFFQTAIPLVVAWLFWKQQDVFAVCVALFWLGTSLVDVGVYAADARAQALALVSPWGDGGDVGHDWTYMLMRFGKLSRDQVIGGRIRGVGMALMPLALAAGGWALWGMPARTPPAPETDEEARLRAHLEGAARRR